VIAGTVTAAMPREKRQWTILVIPGLAVSVSTWVIYCDRMCRSIDKQGKEARLNSDNFDRIKPQG
jgi:hypothetical protein